MALHEGTTMNTAQKTGSTWPVFPEGHLATAPGTIHPEYRQAMCFPYLSCPTKTAGIESRQELSYSTKDRRLPLTE